MRYRKGSKEQEVSDRYLDIPLSCLFPHLPCMLEDMNILSVEHLSKTVREVPLFSDVSFGLDSGEHVGVVGRNGAGKSTLLKVLGKKLPADEGLVSMARECDIATLPQHISFHEGACVDSFLFEGEGKRIELRRRELNHEPVSSSALDGLDCWNLENDYHALLGELEIFDYSQPMAELSGGQLKKAALARLMAAKANLLLLDEPTNHLDIPTIEWLENRIHNGKETVLVVTHDRYFLDTVATSILELDEGTIFYHPGSFASYLERKEARLEDQKKEQARLKNILRRELDWLGHGAKARTTKQQGRIARIQEMQGKVRSVGHEAQRRFASQERRLGKKILQIEHLSKGYGETTLFKDFSYDFLPGDRIGLVGPNGAGKSTMMDIIVGRTAPDAGKLEVGVNTTFAYYDQKSRELPLEKTITEYVSDIAERIRLSKDEIVSPGRFLEIFGFPPVMQRQVISSLSGGEQRRLYLVSRLLSNPNFLLLDEPTNDLDLETMENLEQYIRDFSGCVLVVSHDRAFLDQTCTKLFVLGEADRLVHPYEGCYSDYEAEERAAKQRAKQKETLALPRERVHAEKKGLSFREQREFDELGPKIDEATKLRDELEASFATAGTTALGTLAERTAKYEQVGKELEAMEKRWLELGEKAENA